MRSAEARAYNLVVDQIHKQTECECEYLDETLTKMCAHHKFQVIAIGNALRAYARECVEAWREKAAKEVESALSSESNIAPGTFGAWVLRLAAALRALPGES